MMNQNNLYTNGSPSIIDSIPLSSRTTPFNPQMSSLNKDYASSLLQSPSTQNTYSSVDGNSSGRNNNLSVKGYGQNDNNNFKVKTQLVDSMLPNSYNQSNLSSISSQYPSSLGSQSYSNSTGPFQINSLLSNGNIGASISTSGESPHPDNSQKRIQPININITNPEGNNLQPTGSNLSQFFKNQGYSFSTATSPSSNSQPLQSLSFHHQASFQSSNATKPSSFASNSQKSDFISKYVKDGQSISPNSTMTLQPPQQISSTSPYQIGQVNSLQQSTPDLATQQLKDVQKVQQQMSQQSNQAPILNNQQQAVLSTQQLATQQFYSTNTIDQYQVPKRETLYGNGVNIGNMKQDSGNQSTEEIMNKYYQLKTNQLNNISYPNYSTTNKDQINQNQLQTNQQGSLYQQQNISYQSVPPVHYQSLPSLISGHSTTNAPSFNSPTTSFTSNPYQLSQTTVKPYINDSPIQQQLQKFESLLPPQIGGTPLRKESAPVNETQTLGGLLKNNIEQHNLTSPSQPGRHGMYKYQSFDQNSIQKALNQMPNPPLTTLQQSPSHQLPQGMIQVQSQPVLNSSLANQQTVSSPVIPTVYNKQQFDDTPFQLQNPYGVNQIISVQQPYILNQVNSQNNSQNHGGTLISNRQSEQDNLTSISDQLVSATSGAQKIPPHSNQSNDLSNQLKNLQIEENSKLSNKTEPQTKDVFSLYQTVMQQGTQNSQKNPPQHNSPSLSANNVNKQEIIFEQIHPSKSMQTPQLTIYQPNNGQRGSFQNQQNPQNLQSPQLQPNQQQMQQQYSQSLQNSQVVASQQNSAKSPYQIINGYVPKNSAQQQQQQQQQQLHQQQQSPPPYNSKLQQVQGGQKIIYQSGQQQQQPQFAGRKGQFTLIGQQTQPFLKGQKQNNNYKQKIWQNILNQRKNKMNSFHSPTREKAFYGNNLNTSVDDFIRSGQSFQTSPGKKPCQSLNQSFTNSPTQSGQPLQIVYNQYGQPVNLTNNKQGKPGQTNQEQQVQYIQYVNQNGQKVEQKIILKNHPHQQYNSILGNQYYDLRSSEENPPKINIEAVNNNINPSENTFYGDQKAMTFSKISANSAGSQNSGQNSPAFNSIQRPNSPQSKKAQASQFALAHEQLNLNKRNSKQDKQENLVGGSCDNLQYKTPQGEIKNGVVKETLNRAMRMSFGGESSNEAKTVQI